MKKEFKMENGTSILMFGGVKGLIRDGEDLKETLQCFRPDVVCVSIPEESIDSLKKFMEDPYELTLSDYEIIYGTILSEFGEVMVPPPIYMEAVKYARHFSIKLEGIDLDEDSYSQVYMDNMKSMDLIAHSVRKRRIMHHSFKSTTPEDFVEEWTSMVNRVKGLSRIDNERLKYIEERSIEIISSNPGKSIAFVLDYEFHKDFVDFIENSLNHSGPEALE